MLRVNVKDAAMFLLFDKRFCLLAQDKAIFGDGVWIFFLFLHENICCGYPFKTPHLNANGYPHHAFMEIFTEHSFCMEP